MRVPLSWLKTFVDWDEGIEELARVLTLHGLATDAIDWPGRGCAGIITARVDSVAPHPSRPHLAVLTLSAGARRGTVVSAAPDLTVGLGVTWALPGSVLPGQRSIDPREFGGILSEGMLCSEQDLGLAVGGDEALARLDLPPGEDLVSILSLDDPVLDIELTPNYAVHCQSILGVAREVAALTGGDLRLPEAGGGEIPEGDLRITVTDPALCSRYVARVVRFPTALGKTPWWIARRLCQCGVRPVDPIVDVTNYVMLELGQPLHAFDRGKWVGPTISVRPAAAGEAIVTLDGRQRALAPGDIVIADAAGPTAIAGVMGGERTEIGPDTRTVLLESAVFQPEAVLRTARLLGLISEASARFSRGVDPDGAGLGADRAVHLLGLLGGQISAGTDFGPARIAPRHVSLRGARMRQWIGVRLSTAAAGRLLGRLGFEIQADGADRLRVRVPSWRGDVREEVDLIEEVCRMYGYQRVPASLPPGAPAEETPSALATMTEMVRSLALGAGFSEILPYSFHARALLDRMRLGPAHPWRRAVTIANPMRPEQEVLRATAATSLLRVLELNAHHQRIDAACFEIGRVFAPGEPRPHEIAVLAFGGMGLLRPASWQQPGQSCDFYAVKGLAQEIAVRAGIGLERLTFTVPDESELPFLHPGRAALCLLDGQAIGWIGEIHPEVQAAFDLPIAPTIGEIRLQPLCASAQAVPHSKTLPRFPAVRRDLSLVVGPERTAAEVVATIASAGDPSGILAGMQLFDVYQGPGLDPGQRSLTFALTFQSDRTLRDAEVDQVMATVIDQVTRTLGATVRGR